MSATNFVSYANATEIVGKIGTKLDALTGALVYRGTVTFSNLPSTLTKAMAGYTYNVSNEFTTDIRFVEGAGKKFPAGTDVAIADLSTYDEVTPVGSENPKTAGWYEYNSTTGRYFPTEDEVVDNEKTYYQYNEVLKFNVGAGFIDVDTINTRINNVRDMITENAFDTATAYSIGDIVSYEDGLYKFKSAHVAGAWDANEVDEIDVLSLVSSAEPDSLTTAQINALLALLD